MWPVGVGGFNGIDIRERVILNTEAALQRSQEHNQQKSTVLQRVRPIRSETDGASRNL